MVYLVVTVANRLFKKSVLQFYLISVLTSVS